MLAFKVHLQSCLQEKVYIIQFQFRVNRHVCDVINFILNVILSFLLVNIAVSFSLRFA